MKNENRVTLEIVVKYYVVLLERLFLWVLLLSSLLSKAELVLVLLPTSVIANSHCLAKKEKH